MSEAVWIFAENGNGELTEASLELLCEGKRLADLYRSELCAVLFGFQVESLPKALSQYGAEKVYLADHELFKTYHPELFTDLLAGLVRTYDPGVLLLSSALIGQDLAPRVAARLRINLVSNCDKLEMAADGSLLLNRLIYQNKVHCTVTCPGSRPQMATLATGITKIRKTLSSKEIKIIPVEHTVFLQSRPPRIEFLEFIKADPRTIDISEAEVIVSGGKGAENDIGFQMIRDLADVLEAALAGSRMAVDNQWIDRTRQIGQSGNTVSPNLMISCGVSGANAHIFGMRDTKTLIAINKDKTAPIMKIADLAVEGDLREIIPALIQSLQDIKASKG
jgi:electron transfer flavoprotein alpha subunit